MRPKRISYTTYVRLFALLLLCTLSACTQTPNGPNSDTNQQTPQSNGFMRADAAGQHQSGKLVIRNKSSHNVTCNVTLDNGDANSYSTSSLTTGEYVIVASASALTIDGTSITSGSTTTVTLSDGTQVDVTWNGNAIAINDTLEMN